MCVKARLEVFTMAACFVSPCVSVFDLLYGSWESYGYCYKLALLINYSPP